MHSSVSLRDVRGILLGHAVPRLASNFSLNIVARAVRFALSKAARTDGSDKNLTL